MAFLVDHPSKRSTQLSNPNLKQSSCRSLAIILVGTFILVMALFTLGETKTDLQQAYVPQPVPIGNAKTTQTTTQTTAQQTTTSATTTAFDSSNAKMIPKKSHGSVTTTSRWQARDPQILWDTTTTSSMKRRNRTPLFESLPRIPSTSFAFQSDFFQSSDSDDSSKNSKKSKKGSSSSIPKRAKRGKKGKKSRFQLSDSSSSTASESASSSSSSSSDDGPTPAPTATPEMMSAPPLSESTPAPTQSPVPGASAAPSAEPSVEPSTEPTMTPTPCVPEANDCSANDCCNENCSIVTPDPDCDYDPPTELQCEPAISNFDDGPEGWFVSGIRSSGTETGSVEFDTENGNPGGLIFVDDTVAPGTWYWNAPTKFLGNRESAYGGELKYDFRVSDTGNPLTNQPDIRLIDSNGVVLSLFDLEPPNSDFRTYTIGLDETQSAWRVGTLSNDPLATEAEIRAVLGDLAALLIRGEYQVGADTGFLDNVQLDAVCTDQVVPVRRFT